MLQTALHFSHTLLREIVQPADQVIDATMGNGNDTAFLAELVGKLGKVYAFDVQAAAIQNTEKRLQENQLSEQALLFHQGHETIAEIISPETPIKAAVFNLGYLPKSDKEIITMPDTTRTAIEAILERLVVKGRIILVVYYGHEGGEQELTMVKNFCKALPQRQFNVLSYQFVNQANQPPILYCIEKK
ncbi:class I SAM-dependent methyltransferase [Enterococcus sp. BWR-S5]|uniref:class I SAM-dependent methyltransferase n=1 Tax=Enterococcus sp. BWR-S5 TaxID=2787714 RepID=UPI001922ED12|nr:class I SAM-dependent methyltransferase [Enterococcus sp. BWR-S5]MBL1223509.1 methyltransferase domain-containing protein [Enterococcus sp. BWR-S5]